MEYLSEIWPYKNEIINMYINGYSAIKISKKFNTFSNTIIRLLRKNKIEIRDQKNSSILEKRDIIINDNLMDKLNGWLLGDGSLTFTGIQGHFTFVSKHEEYINYVIDSLLKNKIKSKKYSYIDKTYNKKYFRIRSVNTLQFGDLYHKWYIDGIKKVPKNLDLNSQIIKCWIMDDGTRDKTKGILRLCTNSFSITECENLAKKLNTFINVNDIHIIESGLKTTRIYLSRKSSNKLMNILGDCDVKCFEYKWGIR